MTCSPASPRPASLSPLAFASSPACARCAAPASCSAPSSTGPPRRSSPSARGAACSSAPPARACSGSLPRSSSRPPRSTRRSARSRRCSHEEVRTAGSDPASGQGAEALDADGAREGAQKGRLRRGADNRLPGRGRTRARQGARRGRPARLRAPRRRRPLAARRARCCFAPLDSVADSHRQPRRHQHASGNGERARPRDRRGRPRRRRGNRRGRRHDLRGRPCGRRRRGSRRPTSTSPGRRNPVNRTAVLAYSGGLDTSCAIAWLKEDYCFEEVVAVLVDVGQEASFGPAVERGRLAGADDVLLLDRKEAFAEEQVAKALLANALYEGKYPLVSALSRPVIAQAVAEIALELGAEAVVHGCTGKGNDQLRFELAFKAHFPYVTVIAPLRDRTRTRDEEIEYALEKGIPVVQTAAAPYSIDENLFGRAIEAGILEDPWKRPPSEAYALTSDPATAPA